MKIRYGLGLAAALIGCVANADSLHGEYSVSVQQSTPFT